MNSIEEQLWAYIDGTCTAQEQAHTAALIASSEEYQQQYQELLVLHNDFATFELDEPPMAFTYNVMEQIRTQEALVPLKAAINKRIILGIAGFFVITILALLAFALKDMNWSSTSTGTFKLPVQVSVPKVNGLFTGHWMQSFLFFDVVLGLFLFDAWLRKRANGQQHEAIN
jgi:hypothetical protein